MENKKPPTMAELRAKIARPTQGKDTSKPAQRQQCNDCKFYRWALHKKRGTYSFCQFTGEATDPTFKPCEFFVEAVYEQA